MSVKNILNDTINCNSNELVLKWNNLSYSIINKKKEIEKTILNNVSGFVKSKSFTAILGPSGAGKTTLLEGISCRSDSVKGTVTLNGYFMSNSFMKEISGFLPQHDIAFNSLTTKEYLQFTCTLKLHKLLHIWERKLRVSDILHKFNLEKCTNTNLSKLSGGEKRRLFLGIQLLSDPAIIFCDEPTTGLDSYNALEIISVLKKLSLSGKIVMISIHQPSSALIQYFDNFILLSMGTVVLHGNQENISNVFNKMNLSCPIQCNIAEFYIKQLSIIPGDEQNCIRKINKIQTQFLNLQAKNNEDIPAVLKTINFTEKLKCSYKIQFVWLLWRELIIRRRQILTDFITYVIILVTAFTIAIFYSSAKHNIENVQDLNGFLFLIVSELLFSATYAVLYTFPYEIPIFKSEKDLYSSSIYYLVKICSEIPQVIIFPYSFLFILYFIVPFTLDVYLYTKIGFVMCISSFTAKAYGFMLSAFSDSTDYVNLIIVPMDTIFLITSGIFLNVDTLPFIFTWLKYISTFFYSFDAISSLYWNNYFEIGCTSDVLCSKNNTNLGIQYLEHNYFYDLYNLIILALVMHCIGCFILIRRKKSYYKGK